MLFRWARDNGHVVVDKETASVLTTEEICEGALPGVPDMLMRKAVAALVIMHKAEWVCTEEPPEPLPTGVKFFAA